MAKKVHLNLRVTTDQETGEVLSAYFHVREGKTSYTEEVVEGTVFVDYDRNGNLLGVEMLAPCKVQILDRIARELPEKDRARTRRFLKQSIPREMVATK